MYVLGEKGLKKGLPSSRWENRSAGVLSVSRHGEQSRDILSKALIVSYSYSGNTHEIARTLQSVTGADWCEIYPWQSHLVRNHCPASCCLACRA